MSKFNDEEYNGLVIKLPKWFIDLNNLNDILSKLKDDIESNVSLSTMFPDYEKSMYELEHYSDKIDITKEIKKSHDESEERIRKYYQSRVNKEIFDITWTEVRHTLIRSKLYIGDDVYELDDLLELKSKDKKILTEINNRINNLNKEEIEKFVLDNNLNDVNVYEYDTHWRFTYNTIYIDNYMNPSFRFEILSIKWYVDRYHYYDNLRLWWDHNDYYFILPTKRKGGKIFLNDYERKDLNLIKK